jgi:dihydrofolate synthase/folylpolyglutamate synthase
MNVAEAKAFLGSLAQFGMRFGLERMERTVQALGRPDRRYRILHVAGTNGKGSTCAFASSILRQAGLRVGLYTSPHLLRVNERIQVNGEEISDESLAEGVSQILQAHPEAACASDPLTFFELGTALALWQFARERVDVAVLEVGLGGRLDATNVVQSQVAVVTHLGLDHTAILGDTLTAIATEKAGIFKPGSLPVIARQEAEALAVLTESARRVGRALLAGSDFALEGEGLLTYSQDAFRVEGISLSLLGAHQKDNAETAIAAARAMESSLTAPVIRQGLAATRWPGRLQIVGRDPLILLDGAHNPDGARALAKAMRELFPDCQIHLVFGMLADKDVAGVARELAPLANKVWVAKPASERAMETGPLRTLMAGMGASATCCQSVAQALELAREGAKAAGHKALVLVAGSLYLVGEAQALLGCGS